MTKRLSVWILIFTFVSSLATSCTKRSQITIESLKDYHTISAQPNFKGRLKLEVDAGSVQFRLGCTNDEELKITSPTGKVFYGTKSKDGAFISIDIKSPAQGSYEIDVENDVQCNLTVWANPKITNDSPWAEPKANFEQKESVVSPSVAEQTSLQTEIREAYEKSLETNLYRPSFSEVFKNSPTPLPPDFSKSLVGSWVEGIPIALPRALSLEQESADPIALIKQKLKEFSFLPNQHIVWTFDSAEGFTRNEIPGTYKIDLDRVRVKVEGSQVWNSLLHYNGTLFVSSSEMGPIPLIRLNSK